MTNDPSELQALERLLNQTHRAWIASHIMPDGDTIGSALGLAAALRQHGIETRLACADPVPLELRFLPGSERYTTMPPTDEDTILVVDTSDLGRIGSLYRPDLFARLPVINIDHHITNLRFGTLNWVVPKSSTAELILDLITALGLPLDAEIAVCLLTGIVTDTRAFRTNSTTAASLNAAAALMQAGASLPQITDAVYNHRPLETLRVWGLALAGVQAADGLVWVQVSQEMVRQAGATDEAVSGLSNFLSTFENRIAVVFHELASGQTDVSMRSVPGLDVAAIAYQFGGGGHPQAAGCLLPGPLAHDRERVLAALRAALAAFKP